MSGSNTNIIFKKRKYGRVDSVYFSSGNTVRYVANTELIV